MTDHESLEVQRHVDAYFARMEARRERLRALLALKREHAALVSEHNDICAKAALQYTLTATLGRKV